MYNAVPLSHALPSSLAIDTDGKPTNIMYMSLLYMSQSIMHTFAHTEMSQNRDLTQYQLLK